MPTAFTAPLATIAACVGRTRMPHARFGSQIDYADRPEWHIPGDRTI